MTNGILYLRRYIVDEATSVFYLSVATMDDITPDLAERLYLSVGHPHTLVPSGQESRFKTPLEAKEAGTNAGYDVVEDLDFEYFNGFRDAVEERATAEIAAVPYAKSNTRMILECVGAVAFIVLLLSTVFYLFKG